MAQANISITSTGRAGVYSVSIFDTEGNPGAGSLATAINAGSLNNAVTLMISTSTGVALNEDDVKALLTSDNALVTKGTLKSLNLSSADCSYPGDNNTTKNWENVLYTDKLNYLENFTYPKSIVNIPQINGANTTYLKKIVLPKKDSGSNYILSNGTFRNVTNLETLQINNCVTDVPENLCANLKKLTSIDLNCPVTKIGSDAFTGCESLKYISLPEGLTEICSSAFNNCAISGIRLPSTLITIGEAAFQDCKYLEQVIIPTNVTSISNNAFLRCNSLKDVYVKNANTAIHQDAFSPETFSNNIQSLPTDASVNRESYWRQGTDFNVSHANGQAVLHIFNNSTNQDLINEFKSRRAGTKTINDNTMYDLVDANGVHWPSQDDGSTVYGNAKEDAISSENWKRFVLAEEYADEYTVNNIIDDTWYTICVPFNVTRSQLQSAFGSSTEVCSFVGVKDVTINDESTLNLKFTNDLMRASTATGSTIILQADHAYMIHPSTHVESTGTGTSAIFTITGVTMPTAEELAARTPVPTAGSTDTGYRTGYSFVGNYATNAKLSDNIGSYFLAVASGQRYPKFYRATAKSGRWTQFTAIVKAPSNEAKNMSIYFGDNAIDFDDMIIEGEATTTAVNDINTNANIIANTDNRVFNMQGVCVGNSLNGLTKGLYIVNGKKYIVR